MADTLLAQLVENRDDLALWGVYADQLQSQNDPRGPLVAIMLERERTPTPKLFAAERTYRKKHLKDLLPAAWARQTVAWWRGFPSAIAIDSPQLLSHIIASPLASFIVSARIALAGDQDEWRAALAGARLPWRRLRIDADVEHELAMAPWVTAAPALEQLRVGMSEYAEVVVSFEGAEAQELALVAIDSAADVVELDAAAMPALSEVRLLGTSAEAELFDDDRPRIVRHRRGNDNYEPAQDAFIAIGKLVEASLVEDVAAGLPGVRSLDVQTGHVLDGLHSLTVVRTFASEADSLLPFGLAVALEQRLPPATPFVLLHTSEATEMARACTLGTPPTRTMVPPSGAAELLRTMLDEQSGRDPGIDVLLEAIEALDCAPRITIVGASVPAELATDIDPQTLGPLPEYEDEFEAPVYREHMVDLYLPAVDDAPVGEEAAAVEAPSLVDAVADLDHELAEEAERDVDVEVELPAEAEIAVGDTTDAALRVDRIPDGRQAWLDLLSTWAERERDPDDEFAPRFPDPELQWSEHVDFEAQKAPDTCESCEAQNVILHVCSWCGAVHCATCTVRPETGGVWCHACIVELAEERVNPSESSTGLTADDIVAIESELVDDVAELQAVEAAIAAEAGLDDAADDDWYER